MTLRDYLNSKEGKACASICYFGPRNERLVMSAKEAKKHPKVLDLRIDRITETKSGETIVWLY